MKTLTILLLSLPGLALAAGPESFRPVSIPTVSISGPAVRLPSPKIPMPIMTPAQVAAVYTLPSPKRPGEDLLGGVPAKLIPPTRPLAPAGAAAFAPARDEKSEAKTDDLMKQLEKLFDNKGGCWKPAAEPVRVPEHA